MPTNHEVVAALPAAANANHALLRALIVKRMSFNLTTAEDSRDFVMIDPDGAGTVPSIIQNGRLYAVDLTDATTAHDGILCLVSYDAVRYKIDDLSLPYSVLDKDLTAPPGSPTIGDTYLIYGTPTGAWAGKSGYIARYCSRGWEFALPPIGFRVLVEDEGTSGSFYFRDPNGDWIAGLGSVLVGADTIPVSAIINAARTSFIVENRTTNTPPGSPTVGVAYIIGPSPTGVWADKAAQVAVCEATGAWSYYVPTNGFQAYDKSLNAPYVFNGTAWISAAGVWVGRSHVFTAAAASPAAVSTTAAYSYSATVAPTTGQYRIVDAVTKAHTANRASTGATDLNLRIRYSAAIDAYTTGAGAALVSADQPGVIALFRDSEVNAIAWQKYGHKYDPLLTTTYTDPDFVSHVFLVPSPDTAAHIYTIALMPAVHNSAGADDPRYPSTISRRTIEIEEAA